MVRQETKTNYLNSYLLASIAALLLGISKGGIKGLGILVVSILAVVYGAKASTGIMVPLLIFGDILAVIYFKKHVKWSYLVQFMPPMIFGVLIAVYVGNDWNELIFKRWMSLIILVSVIYMFYREYKSINFNPNNKIFRWVAGFAAGFTTMIGNLAGPFANLYFLATKIPKNEIVATSAWVFFFINLFKLPFHIFSWETITKDSFMTNLGLFPFVAIGFYCGIQLLKLFDEKTFRKFILIVTAIGAVVILLK